MMRLLPFWAAAHVEEVHRALDLAAMALAGQCLLGKHDFSAFRSSQCQAKTAERHVLQFEVYEQHDCGD